MKYTMFIFQKQLQFIHIHNIQYIILLFTNSNFSPKNCFNLISPFLIFTDSLFIFPFLRIFLSVIMKINFHITQQNHRIILKFYDFSFVTPASIINEVLILSEYSALPDRIESVGALVNNILLSLVSVSSSTYFTVSNNETLLLYLSYFVSMVEFFSLFLKMVCNSFLR